MKIRNRIAVSLSIVLGIFTSAYAVEPTKDSLDTVKKLIAEKKAVLVDVREKSEWDEGHLKDAIHLPLSAIKKGVSAEELSKITGKDTVVYLHCRSGARSLDAAKRLATTKRDLRSLEAGYDDLLKAGFPQAK
jgi:phage shock protein E